MLVRQLARRSRVSRIPRVTNFHILSFCLNLYFTAIYLRSTNICMPFYVLDEIAKICTCFTKRPALHPRERRAEMERVESGIVGFGNGVWFGVCSCRHESLYWWLCNAFPLPASTARDLILASPAQYQANIVPLILLAMMNDKDCNK